MAMARASRQRCKAGRRAGAQAPSEAEAQCAALCKAGHVYAMASEDMDSLTFATPRLTRQLMAPSSQKVPVTEYDYDQASALEAPPPSLPTHYTLLALILASCTRTVWLTAFCPRGKRSPPSFW